MIGANLVNSTKKFRLVPKDMNILRNLVVGISVVASGGTGQRSGSDPFVFEMGRHSFTAPLSFGMISSVSEALIPRHWPQ
jgi:hypothetical protein